MKFKPSEAPSDDIQQISPPALASYSKASAGLGSLDFFGAQKKGQWLKAALSDGITLPIPVRYNILSMPTPAFPPVSLLQEKPPPSTHVTQTRNLAAILDLPHLHLPYAI